MSTFLLLVNPELAYDPYPDWNEWSPKLSTQPIMTTWNTGSRRHGMEPGDRAIIVRVGSNPRGAVATAVITGNIWVGPHWNPEARRTKTGFVDIRISSLYDLDEPFPLSELRELAPSVQWTPQQSGTRLPDETQSIVELLDDIAPFSAPAEPFRPE